MRVRLRRLNPITVLVYWTPGVFFRTASDLAGCLRRGFQRRGFGQLHLDVHVSLIFVGQEAGGQHLPAQETPATTNAASDRHGEGRSSESSPWHARTYELLPLSNIAVEPAEELRKWAMGLFLGPEKQCSKRRAQGQGVEG